MWDWGLWWKGDRLVRDHPIFDGPSSAAYADRTDQRPHFEELSEISSMHLVLLPKPEFNIFGTKLQMLSIANFFHKRLHLIQNFDVVGQKPRCGEVCV